VDRYILTLEPMNQMNRALEGKNSKTEIVIESAKRKI
jgi:hypothetical protein